MRRVRNLAWFLVFVCCVVNTVAWAAWESDVSVDVFARDVTLKKNEPVVISVRVIYPRADTMQIVVDEPRAAGVRFVKEEIDRVTTDTLHVWTKTFTSRPLSYGRYVLDGGSVAVIKQGETYESQLSPLYISVGGLWRDPTHDISPVLAVEADPSFVFTHSFWIKIALVIAFLIVFALLVLHMRQSGLLQWERTVKRRLTLRDRYRALCHVLAQEGETSRDVIDQLRGLLRDAVAASMATDVGDKTGYELIALVRGASSDEALARATEDLVRVTEESFFAGTDAGVRIRPEQIACVERFIDIYERSDQSTS